MNYCIQCGAPSGGLKRCSLRCALLSKTAIRETGCWEWTGALNGTPGYGYMAWNGRHYLTHRAAWIVANGREVPEGLHVCHTCDNRICVNPSHIWLGTPQDNMDDMHAKGRAKLRSPPSGIANPAHKLTEEDVAFIRSVPRKRGYRQELSRRFGVCDETIGRVALGHHWSS